VTTAVNISITILRLVTAWSWHRGTKLSETSSVFTFKITWKRRQCFPLNTTYMFVLIVMSIRKPSTSPRQYTYTNVSEIRHVFYNSVLSRQTLTCSKSAGNRVWQIYVYLFSYTFLQFLTISWPLETEHQYIMLCDWARTQSFVYNATRTTTSKFVN
jgi:hypothetical protein